MSQSKRNAEENKSVQAQNLIQQNEQRNIFIRAADKLAFSLNITLPIDIGSLRTKIAKFFKLSNDSFALFYQGKNLEDIGLLKAIKDKGIIHLVKIHQTLKPILKIHFREQKKEGRVFQICVSSQEKIKNVIEQHIKSVIGKGMYQIFLVYLGKPLNIYKTLSQQIVQNQCEIIIVDFKLKNNLNGTFVTINNSHCVIDAVNKSSTQLTQPYRENRTQSDHQNFKKKLIQKMEKQSMKKHGKPISSMFQIEEKGGENQEKQQYHDPQRKIEDEDDISYQIRCLSQMKIQEGPEEKQLEPQKKNIYFPSKGNDDKI